jgi:transcriptional regulator with XRE-family HTH domain
MKLTQVDFAKKINASPTSVAHYELASRRPDPHTLARITRVAVNAKLWEIAATLAAHLPGVADGLLKPAWVAPTYIQVTYEKRRPEPTR